MYFVIHSTEGGYEGSVSWLRNPASEASSDEVISLTGSRVTILNRISSGMKTWEVGNANSLCVGFECEGYANRTTWPNSLYVTLADRLIRAQAAVKAEYGVTIPLRLSTRQGQAGIVSHKQIALWYGGSDHTDPGSTFDWTKLARAIALLTAPPQVTYGVIAAGPLGGSHIVDFARWGHGNVRAMLESTDLTRILVAHERVVLRKVTTAKELRAGLPFG